MFEKKINDEVSVDAIGRETDEHAQITDRPNGVTDASVHRAFRKCRRWLRQSRAHDGASAACVKSKIVGFASEKMRSGGTQSVWGRTQRARPWRLLNIESRGQEALEEYLVTCGSCFRALFLSCRDYRIRRRKLRLLSGRGPTCHATLAINHAWHHETAKASLPTLGRRLKTAAPPGL